MQAQSQDVTIGDNTKSISLQLTPPVTNQNPSKRTRLK